MREDTTWNATNFAFTVIPVPKQSKTLSRLVLLGSCYTKLAPTIRELEAPARDPRLLLSRML